MSTPVISAPTLVTSTNPVTCATPPVTPPKEEWRTKYLEAKGNCRKLKAQMREQAKKSRQLIVAVKNKLQEEENEKLKVQERYDFELSSLCQQILNLQASMLREQNRVDTILSEKDQMIARQSQELIKLKLETSSASSTVSTITASSSLSTTSATSVSVSNSSLSSLRPVAIGGSLRNHGSFRQYKKDREKIRQQLKSNLSGDHSSSSGINVNSSEESSSSPSTLPRSSQKLSCMKVSATNTKNIVEPRNNTKNDVTEPRPSELPRKKGILKAVCSTESNAQDHVDHLVELATTTKIKINPEDRSDSGRESDDVIEQNVSVVTVVSTTDSANSSFDGSDPTLAWKINVLGEEPLNKNKKMKPPPPPRSSQTKLTTLKPKSILSPTSSLNAELSPTEALDNLIFDNNRLRQSEKKKRVKFNPKIDTSSSSKMSTPLDPSFLHFLPKTTTTNNQFARNRSTKC